ncbi:MAG TPA: IclR family transcriptional regulator [Terriglobia bacterium]|nr:IclR family transcriptional regulator [Terriglobia bacterium]
MAKGTASNSKRKPQADKNYISVMGKIFAVLQYFINRGGKQEPVAFQEIASALPFARTTVHRILYSLGKLGYLEKVEGGSHYRLAEKFFELTGPAVHFRRLQSVAKSVMVKLLIQFAETVNLGVLENGHVSYIDVLQSPSALRIAANPGERNPAHSTALGKAILAFLAEEEVQSILEQNPLIKMTPRTITQKARLFEHLATIREQGVVFDLEENLTGVVCVAAPIFDRLGRVVASISVSGPASRMESKLLQVQEEVRQAGVEISRALNPQRAPTAIPPPSRSNAAPVETQGQEAESQTNPSVRP